MSRLFLYRGKARARAKAKAGNKGNSHGGRPVGRQFMTPKGVLLHQTIVRQWMSSSGAQVNEA